MKRKQILPSLLIVIILSACQASTPEISPIQPATEQLQSLIPTDTAIPPSSMPTPSSISTQTKRPSSPENQPDIKFSFISETIPDGTRFNPGEVFRKTWTIKNNSTQNWEGFSLAVESSTPDGELLGSPSGRKLSKSAIQFTSYLSRIRLYLHGSGLVLHKFGRTTRLDHSRS